MFLRWLIDLLEKVELGIIDPEYEPDFDDYEYRQRTAERKSHDEPLG